VDNSEMLETVLSRHLRPVRAPEALWDRVQNPPVMRARRAHLVWALAAAAVVAVGLWGFHPREESTAALERGIVDFRSSEPAKVRAWVRANTGLDIPLRLEATSLVVLIGASMVKGGRAEIIYRADGYDAALVVSKAASAAGDGHRFVSRGNGVASWTMHGQLYTVACADPQAACLLCHGGGMAFN
jgi:hypothetical protein